MKFLGRSLLSPFPKKKQEQFSNQLLIMHDYRQLSQQSQCRARLLQMLEFNLKKIRSIFFPLNLTVDLKKFPALILSK